MYIIYLQICVQCMLHIHGIVHMTGNHALLQLWGLLREKELIIKCQYNYWLALLSARVN